MEKEFPVMGFDIGGTKIAVCLAMSSGEILGSRRFDNKDKTPDEALPQLVQIGKELLEEAKLKTSDLRAIGIGSPAPMDIPNGIIVAPPNNKTWRNVPIRDYISSHFGVETFFDNDANAGALAEWMFGAGRNCENMIYLTMSTGIGGGIIANGHLLRGNSFSAGEVGHIVLDLNGPECNCGMKGCYEAFCGGRALAQRMQRELAGQPDHPMLGFADGKIENLDLIALENGVKAGNGYAVKLWDEMCLRNAQGIGTFINIFNPEIIVLGTIAMAAGDLFLDPVKKYLPRFCWDEPMRNCELKVTALGRSIGEYSGFCVALNYLYEHGEWRKMPWQE